MGNAVLKFENSVNFNKCENIILIWGDIPYISSRTVKHENDVHLNNSNHFTLLITCFQPIHFSQKR